MICVHRLRGEELWVNPDLVLYVESAGKDTHITLADGGHLAVAETPSEVASAVVAYRASVLAAAECLERTLTGTLKSGGE